MSWKDILGVMIPRHGICEPGTQVAYIIQEIHLTYYFYFINYLGSPSASPQ